MKRQPNETHDHLRHRIFMARTAMIYKHQREAAEKANYSISFDLKWLREHVLYGLSVSELWSCRYCGERLTVRNFSVDHRIPIARGGNWNEENIQIICQRCNSRKGNLTASEYQQLIDVLASWTKEAKADVLRRLAAGGRALSFYFRGKRDVSKNRDQLPARAPEYASTTEFF